MEWPLLLLVALAIVSWIGVFAANRITSRRGTDEGNEVEEEGAVEAAVTSSLVERIFGRFLPW
jgi:hypothetical protein